MSRPTTTATSVERIAAAAGAIDHTDLPPAIQAEAEAFLTAYAKRLPELLRAHRNIAAGQPPVSPAGLAIGIKGELESALLLIASYGMVPPLGAAGDELKMLDAFGLERNDARRAAVNDPASPLCLPLRLHAMMRARERGAEPPPDAGYSLAERLMFTASKITVPPEFDRWLRTAEGGGGDHYREWAARRQAARENQDHQRGRAPSVPPKEKRT